MVTHGHSQIFDGLIWSNTLEWFEILSDTHIPWNQKLLKSLGYLQTLLTDILWALMVLVGFGLFHLVVSVGHFRSILNLIDHYGSEHPSPKVNGI